MTIDENILSKSYSSKIILLGEYGVIHGGEILASPLSVYSANWIIDDKFKGYKKELLKIHDFLKSNGNQKIDLDKFLGAINSGIRLHSTIYTGYGIGSSGSITAGIYDAFAYHKSTDLEELKQHLIDIESCFHGVSSGIDPLVIYLDQPIHINAEGIQVIDQPIDMSNYFLLDTHIHRKTGPLVKEYLEQAENSQYMSAIEDYKSLNRLAIEAQLSNDVSSLSAIIGDLSQWQYENLDFAILDEHKELWESTLDRADVSLKLCGAGGGGFIIGYAEDVDAVINDFYDEMDVVRLG